jgi:hypothetical protein
MALEPCAECRRLVSTRASACPHCGAPPPSGTLLPVARAMLSPGGADLSIPSPAFWKAVRVVLRRIRIGSYGLGSAIFAGVLTGSFVFKLTGWTIGAGVLSAIVLCLVGLMFEIFETSLGKGGPNED